MLSAVCELRRITIRIEGGRVNLSLKLAVELEEGRKEDWGKEERSQDDVNEYLVKAVLQRCVYGGG
jgi:hypothetical protein